MEDLSFINKDFNEKIDKKIEIIHLTELYEDIKVLKYKNYYNISKFKNTTGKPRKISSYLKSDQTREIIKIAIQYYKLENNYIGFIYKGNNENKGTYLHKSIFHHALSWIDVVYAIKVSQILDENEKKLLYSKNNKIDELQQLLNDINKNMNNQNEILNDVKNINIKQNETITTINNNLNTLTRTVAREAGFIRNMFSSMQITREKMCKCKSVKVIKFAINDNINIYHFIYCQIDGMKNSINNKMATMRRDYGDEIAASVSIFKIYKLTNDSTFTIQNIFSIVNGYMDENNLTNEISTSKIQKSITMNSEHEVNLFDRIDESINNASDLLYERLNINSDEREQTDRILDDRFRTFNVELINNILNGLAPTSRQLQESVMGLYDNIAESLEQIF